MPAICLELDCHPGPRFQQSVAQEALVCLNSAVGRTFRAELRACKMGAWSYEINVVGDDLCAKDKEKALSVVAKVCTEAYNSRCLRYASWEWDKH